MNFMIYSRARASTRSMRRPIANWQRLWTNAQTFVMRHSFPTKEIESRNVLLNPEGLIWNLQAG